MQTLNANVAKTHFGDMILKVQKSPITVNNYLKHTGLFAAD